MLHQSGTNSMAIVAVAAVRSLTSQTIINNSVNQYNNHQHTQDYKLMIITITRLYSTLHHSKKSVHYVIPHLPLKRNGGGDESQSQFDF